MGIEWYLCMKIRRIHHSVSYLLVVNFHILYFSKIVLCKSNDLISKYKFIVKFKGLVIDYEYLQMRLVTELYLHVY
jgi:hypothetical protein